MQEVKLRPKKRSTRARPMSMPAQGLTSSVSVGNIPAIIGGWHTAEDREKQRGSHESHQGAHSQKRKSTVIR